MTAKILVEPAGESEHDTTDGSWRTVWGYAYEDDEARAVYYVRWSDSELEEAEFVVSVGEWGEESAPSDRACVAALGRVHNGRLAFMLVDAGESSFSDQEFLGTMMSALDVRGSDLAQEFFRIIDTILVEDERLDDLRRRLESSTP